MSPGKTKTTTVSRVGLSRTAKAVALVCGLLTLAGCGYYPGLVGPTQLTPGASVDVVSITPTAGSTVAHLGVASGNRRHILVEYQCNIPPSLSDPKLGVFCEAWLSVDGVQPVGSSVSNGDGFDPSLPSNSSSLFNPDREIVQTRYVIVWMASIAKVPQRTIYAHSAVPWIFNFE